MSETPPSPENPILLAAYSGTTVENYRNNAYVTDAGKVFYDKSRTSSHSFPEIFFDTTLRGTLRYTAVVAYETDGVPVIMGGRIERKYLKEMNLPSGTHFPVEKLWVPREGINIKDLVTTMIRLGNKDSAIANLVEVDPKSLLESDE
jgi:hypothetical protein